MEINNVTFFGHENARKLINLTEWKRYSENITNLDMRNEYEMKEWAKQLKNRTNKIKITVAKHKLHDNRPFTLQNKYLSIRICKWFKNS